MPEHRHGLSTAAIETVAGLSAGLISTIIVHPLDIIKTRLQLDTSAHPLLNSSRLVFRDIWRNEGASRAAALYRGLTPNLVGNSASWALYFLWYKQAQDLIRSYRNYAPDAHLSSLDYLTASAGAGLLSAGLTNPVWVVKTRMLSTSATEQGAYPSMWSGLKSIYRTEGLRGYFHGLTPTLIGVSHGALYFVAYEKIKFWQRASKKGANKDLTNVDTIVASSLSKAFAGTLTYPHQVVRARLQAYNLSLMAPTTRSRSDVIGAAADGGTQMKKKAFTSTGQGVISLVASIWRNEGSVGFYKGLGPNLFRVVPSTCVTFLIYENTKWLLPRLVGEEEHHDHHRRDRPESVVGKKGEVV